MRSSSGGWSGNTSLALLVVGSRNSESRPPGEAQFVIFKQLGFEQQQGTFQSKRWSTGTNAAVTGRLAAGYGGKPERHRRHKQSSPEELRHNSFGEMHFTSLKELASQKQPQASSQNQ